MAYEDKFDIHLYIVHLGIQYLKKIEQNEFIDISIHHSEIEFIF